MNKLRILAIVLCLELTLMSEQLCSTSQLSIAAEQITNVCENATCSTPCATAFSAFIGTSLHCLHRNFSFQPLTLSFIAERFQQPCRSLFGCSTEVCGGSEASEISRPDYQVCVNGRFPVSSAVAELSSFYLWGASYGVWSNFTGPALRSLGSYEGSTIAVDMRDSASPLLYLGGYFGVLSPQSLTPYAYSLLRFNASGHWWGAAADNQPFTSSSIVDNIMFNAFLSSLVVVGVDMNTPSIASSYSTQTNTWSSLGSWSFIISNAVAVGNYGRDYYLAGVEFLSTFDFSTNAWDNLGGVLPYAFVSNCTDYMDDCSTSFISLAPERFSKGVYIGGSFETLLHGPEPVVVNNIVYYDGDGGWHPLGAGVTTVSLYGASVSALALDEATNNLYAAGSFTHAGDVVASNVAVWDGVSWCALVGSDGANGVGPSVSPSSAAVTTIARDSARRMVYFGGNFEKMAGNRTFEKMAGNRTAKGIAVWDEEGSEWTSLNGGIPWTLPSEQETFSVSDIVLLPIPEWYFIASTPAPTRVHGKSPSPAAPITDGGPHYVYYLVGGGVFAAVVVVVVLLGRRYPHSRSAPIVTVFLSVADTAVDIGFALSLSDDNSLYILSLAVIGGAAVVNVLLFVTILQSEMKRGRSLRDWVANNLSVVACFGVLSVCKLDVMRAMFCRYCHLSIFTAPVSEKMNLTVYSCGLVGLLLETIPQLGVQIVVLMRYPALVTDLTYVALLFSCVSLLFNLVLRLVAQMARGLMRDNMEALLTEHSFPARAHD